MNKTDWNLICLDRLDFSGNLNRIADMLKDKEASVRRRLKYVWVDLRSPITEAAASDIGKVDYILHLAAVCLAAQLPCWQICVFVVCLQQMR